MEVERFFLPPTKYPQDPNSSFSYFRSFITFYYLSQLLSLDETFFSQLYPSEYYHEYQRIFEKDLNCLIFTYYNQLPSLLYPLPSSVYTYYPFLTFYDNHKKTLYQRRPIILSPAKKLPFRPNRKEVPHEIQITLPLALLSRYPLQSSWWFFVKQKDSPVIYLGTQAHLQHETFHFATLQVRSSSLEDHYSSDTTHRTFDLHSLEYLSFLQPITLAGIRNVFPSVTLKKGSYLFANDASDKESRDNESRRFLALYPFQNLLTTFTPKPNSDWNCSTYKVKKDVALLNIDVNPFYSNAITGSREDQGEDYALDDLTYSHKIKSDFFRCSGSNPNCDLDVLQDEKQKTWVKNMSRPMLTLLVFKRGNYQDLKRIYYLDFLHQLGIKGLLHHYGIYRKQDQDIYLESEVAFSVSSEEYLTLVSKQKGSCNTHYPSRR